MNGVGSCSKEEFPAPCSGGERPPRFREQLCRRGSDRINFALQDLSADGKRYGSHIGINITRLSRMIKNMDPRQADGDMEVVHRINRGETDAFEILVKRHKAHVCRIVKKHVPYDRYEEVAQDVFVRAYTSLSTFRGESGFAHWLSRVAVRTCYDYWRKAYRNRELPVSAMGDGEGDLLEGITADLSRESFENRERGRDAGELLTRALSGLTPEERMIVELVHLEGLSGREAADLLGWSVANVKIRAFRTRKKLKKILLGLMKEGEKR